MTKYQDYVKKMLEANQTLFASFKKLHDEYGDNPDEFQDKFNSEGGKVLAVVRDWEGKLCSQSEKAGFGNYTGGLAEKFHAEIKQQFPLIDHVGIIVKKNPSPFSNLKKIKLF